jgi:hypothetical protein
MASRPKALTPAKAPRRAAAVKRHSRTLAHAGDISPRCSRTPAAVGRFDRNGGWDAARCLHQADAWSRGFSCAAWMPIHCVC